MATLFRPRAIDHDKKMEIIREELPELDFAAVYRTLPPAPTGMDKEEEKETHLAAALSGAKSSAIPVPHIELVANYDTDNIPCCSTDPARPYISFDPITHNAPDYTVCYDLDSQDLAWLRAFNGQHRAGLDEDTFEVLLDGLDKEAAPRGNALSFSRAQRLFPQVARDTLRGVYDYWRSRCDKWKRPLLDRHVEAPDVGNTDPNVPFRPRDKPKPGKIENDIFALEAMLQMREDLASLKKLCILSVERERKKFKLLQLESTEIMDAVRQAAAETPVNGSAESHGAGVNGDSGTNGNSIKGAPHDGTSANTLKQCNHIAKRLAQVWKRYGALVDESVQKVESDGRVSAMEPRHRDVEEGDAVVTSSIFDFQQRFEAGKYMRHQGWLAFSDDEVEGEELRQQWKRARRAAPLEDAERGGERVSYAAQAARGPAGSVLDGFLAWAQQPREPNTSTDGLHSTRRRSRDDNEVVFDYDCISLAEKRHVQRALRDPTVNVEVSMKELGIERFVPGTAQFAVDQAAARFAPRDDVDDDEESEDAATVILDELSELLRAAPEETEQMLRSVLGNKPRTLTMEVDCRGTAVPLPFDHPLALTSAPDESRANGSGGSTSKRKRGAMMNGIHTQNSNNNSSNSSRSSSSSSSSSSSNLGGSVAPTGSSGSSGAAGVHPMYSVNDAQPRVLARAVPLLDSTGTLSVGYIY